MNMNVKFFAVFVLAMNSKGIAGTTRDDGISTVGLPGGKVDEGEDIFAAAVREAKEEGWILRPLGKNLIQTKLVKGKMIAWIPGVIVRRLKNYKEKNRGIKNIYLTQDQVVNSGMGNQNLF